MIINIETFSSTWIPEDIAIEKLLKSVQFDNAYLFQDCLKFHPGRHTCKSLDDVYLLITGSEISKAELRAIDRNIETNIINRDDGTIVPETVVTSYRKDKNKWAPHPQPPHRNKPTNDTIVDLVKDENNNLIGVIQKIDISAECSPGYDVVPLMINRGQETIVRSSRKVNGKYQTKANCVPKSQPKWGAKPCKIRRIIDPLVKNNKDKPKLNGSDIFLKLVETTIGIAGASKS